MDVDNDQNGQNGQNGQPEKPGTKVSLERLRGRQSVRTTFRLSEDVIGLLGIAAEQFGLQQKVLLDQLIDNSEVLRSMAEKIEGGFRDGMAAGRPKTFVLSKRTLHLLEMVSRECRISRDALVEQAVLRLLPVVRSEQDKQKKRLEILGDMVTYLRYGEHLMARSKSLLGEDDQVHEMIEKMVRLAAGNVAKTEAIVGRGRNLQEIDVDIY